VELYAHPMLDASGKCTAVVEFVRDITERKRAEALLGEREQLFRSLFENNASIMLLIDAGTGRIVDANARACRYYGHDRERLLEMSIQDINTLSEREVLEEITRARVEERTFFEFRHRLADGSIRDVEVYSGPITVRGKPHLCSVVHDVTKRRSMERERERLIEELRVALSEVKTLRGLLPICASCKKIRDDRGHWEQLERYVDEHSEATFSHGLCPECAARTLADLGEASGGDEE
jgi:PAS domain S-box-containing protein